MKEVVNIQHQSEGNIHITRWDASSKKKKRARKEEFGIGNVSKKNKCVRNLGL